MSRTSTRVRRRFWIESALGAATAVLGVLTLVWKDWIEVLVGVDPDHGNGSLEVAIVVTALAATFILAGGAGHEWQRARRVAGAGQTP